jgi:hypothetical protein
MLPESLENVESRFENLRVIRLAGEAVSVIKVIPGFPHLPPPGATPR